MGSKNTILDAIATLECLLSGLRLPVDEETKVALYTLGNTITDLLRDSANFVKAIVNDSSKANAARVGAKAVYPNSNEPSQTISIDLEIKEEEPEVAEGQLHECPYCNIKLKSAYILEKHLAKHGDKMIFELPADIVSVEATEEARKSSVAGIEKDSPQIDIRSISIDDRQAAVIAQPQFQCDQCSFETNIIRQMEKHVALHPEFGPFKCQQCDYRTKRMDSLRLHAVRRHGMKNTFQCKKCQFVCSTMKELQVHYDNGRHDVLAVSKTTLQTSDKMILELPGDIVSVDETEEARKLSIASIEKDSPQRVYSISINGKQAAVIAQLQFQCDHCSFETNIIRQMEKHAALHPEFGPFKCQQCDYRTKRMDSLRLHAVRRHGMKNMLQCEKCQFLCSTMKELQIHYDNGRHDVLAVSKIALQTSELMPETSKKVASDTNKGTESQPEVSTSLVETKINKPVDMNISGADAPSTSWFAACKNDLGIVMPSAPQEKKSDLRYQCDLCYFGSNGIRIMEDHARKHTGSRPFKCNDCDYRARRHETFKSHLRKSHGVKNLKCPKCPFAAAAKEDLTEHAKTCSTDPAHHSAEDGTQPTVEDGTRPTAEDGESVMKSSSQCAQLPALLQCTQCAYSTKRKDTLASHILTHSTDYPFICEECGETWKSLGQLRRHVMSRHRKSPLQCDFCDYKTYNMRILTNHSNTHTGEKPFKCDQCDFSAAQSSTVRTHKLTHSDARPFPCDQCSYSCRSACQLRNHKKIHSGSKPHKCAICEYRGVRLQDVKRHMLTHTGEKPFKCSLCKFAASFSDGLKRHMRAHTGERPFKCELCDYRGSQKYFVTIHMKTHNRQVKMTLANNVVGNK